MKKLLLLLTLFVSFNCIGQYRCAFTDTSSLLSRYMKDTLAVMPITKNINIGELYSSNSMLYVKPFSIQEYKPSFRIDSTYLQLIILELERHGYELPKIKKPIPVEYKWVISNTYAPAVLKTNKGDFIISTDSLTAIKQLWNEIERRQKEHEKTMKELYNLLKTNK